jgi:hypothetical protein
MLKRLAAVGFRESDALKSEIDSYSCLHCQVNIKSHF